MVQWFLKEVWLIKTKFGFISQFYKGQELVTRSVQQALCMTLSRDLVNHKKNGRWYKIDARNGKSVMKLVRMSILRPLTFM